MRRSLSKTIVVNATNLGAFLDGIGTYTLNVVRQLVNIPSENKFVIYVNRRGASHLEGLNLPENVKIVRVTGFMSPDHSFPGHLLRLVFANYLGCRHPRRLLFGTSQLESVLFRRNQVVTIHDIIPLQFKELHKRQYHYFRYVLPHVLKRARGIITPSRHSRDLIQSVYNIEGEKIHVIPHGVGSEFGSVDAAEVRPERPFILYAGRMTAMKNVEGILRAFSLLHGRIPHDLVLVGSDRMKGDRSLLAISQRYGIPAERVVVKEYVSTESMATMYRQAAVFVLPSFYEGFGLTAIEAMVSGCPVVVSNVGSLPEICGDAALYVDPRNARSIADAVGQLIFSGEIRERLIKRGVQRARRFSWRRSGQRHIRLMEFLVKEQETVGRVPISVQPEPLRVGFHLPWLWM
jgi:glycosyltransferase involved in cell wall biosynthesis